MSLRFAPRIDPRLRHRIETASKHESAADVTRAVGELAWRLGLVRPSYQQVRVLRSQALPAITPKGSRTIDLKVVFERAYQGYYWLTAYPGFGMNHGYRRKYHPRT